MFRFGVAAWSLGVEQHQVIRKSGSLGFEVVHLDFGRTDGTWESWSVDDMYELLEDIDEYGVKVDAVALNILELYGCAHPSHSAAGKRCREIAFMAIDAAEELNANCVYVPCFGMNEIKIAEDFSRHTEFMYDLCIRSEGTSLTVASENTLNSSNNLKLISDVGHPQMRILFDLYNPVIHGIQPSSLLTAIRPYMCKSVHIKDGVAGVAGDVLIGDGDGTFQECAGLLRSSRFCGSIILENNYSRDTERRVRSDLLRVRTALI